MLMASVSLSSLSSGDLKPDITQGKRYLFFMRVFDELIQGVQHTFLTQNQVAVPEHEASSFSAFFFS